MKKSNLIQLTALCFILSLTAACGGKNSSGGSNSNYTTINKITDSKSNLLAPSLRNSSNGEQVVNIFNQALSYRNSTSETGRILATGFTRGELTSYSNPTSENCKTGTFLKFFEYNYCKGTSSSSTGSTITFASTPTQFCTVLDNNNKLVYASAVQNALPYNYYNCSLSNKVEYSKAKNAELNKILSLNNGTWQLYGASYSGPVIYLLVGAQNSNPSLVYAIDTSYHSVYNPVSIQNVQNGSTVKTLILQ